MKPELRKIRFNRFTFKWMNRNNKNFLWLFLISVMLVGPGCATTGPEPGEKRVRALRDLGASYMRSGNYNLAARYLIEAAEADPGNADIANSLGLVYRELELFDRSLSEFKRALELRPGSPQFLNNMGVTYSLMGRWDDAIACFEKAAGDITYATPHFAFLNLGLAYYNKSEYNRAISYYERAIRANPYFTVAYENIGIAHEALGRWDDAREAYEMAILFEPDSADAYLLLGRLHQRLGRDADAADALKKAFDLDPSGPVGREAQGILRQMGRKTSALTLHGSAGS